MTFPCTAGMTSACGSGRAQEYYSAVLILTATTQAASLVHVTRYSISLSQTPALCVQSPSKLLTVPMRLLDTETCQFVEKARADEETVYAIFSHTWDTEKGEQTYKDLKKIQQRYGPAPQTGHGGLESGTLPSADHDRGGPSLTLPPSQLRDDRPSVTTRPLMPPSTPSRKPWFTRRMTRLKGWFQCSSARNAPQPPPSDPPSATTSPPTALGRLTQSEVDVLVRAVAEAYNLANPTHAPGAPREPYAPSQARESPSKPPPQSIWDDPELSPKIRDACAVARKNGYRYIWIDSCCIDKSSSSELSEAINSMYKWYRLAAVCYAYLADVPPGDDHHAEGSRFRESRWFGRGWTLQELIAPGWVEFLSDDWASIGSKQTLVELVESVTKIDYKALLRLEPLDAFSVAQRLSWAANRETTREEDRAYSLLGIFDIHMPTLYGEGDHAFRRLQEHIMQRFPDQSLFAWGDVYLGSQRVSQLNPDLAGIPNTLRVEARPYYGRRHLFATSPDTFKSCEGVGALRGDAIPLTSSYLGRAEVQYTSTPYGVRTQFQMIPLTRDLLLRTIPHTGEDIQLDFPGSPEDSDYRWYLAILGCEHTVEYSGHLLGRVCYIPPSDSGVELMYTGYACVISRPDQDNVLCRSDLFPLSPETIEHCRPQTELKTVHIPHPDRADLLSNLQYQPYSAIKLLLVKETRDALRFRGYSADLRGPDPDYPTTHRLALSRDAYEHTIAIEFRHSLKNGGRQFSIDAEVRMSGSGVQLDSASDSNQTADRRTVSWTDPGLPWFTTIGPERVRLSAAGAGPLTVDLGLDFVGTGVYILRVDILSDASLASSDIESAANVDRAGEVERMEEQLPPGEIDNGDKGNGRA